MAGKELLPYLGIGKKILCMLPTEQIRLEAVRATEDVLLERLRKKARSGETLTKEALGMTFVRRPKSVHRNMTTIKYVLC